MWQVYHVAAPDTRFAEDTLPLLSSVVGATFDDAGADKDGGEASMPLRTPLDGNASLISSDKAAEKEARIADFREGEADDQVCVLGGGC